MQYIGSLDAAKRHFCKNLYTPALSAHSCKDFADLYGFSRVSATITAQIWYGRKTESLEEQHQRSFHCLNCFFELSIAFWLTQNYFHTTCFGSQ